MNEQMYLAELSEHLRRAKVPMRYTILCTYRDKIAKLSVEQRQAVELYLGLPEVVVGQYCAARADASGVQPDTGEQSTEQTSTENREETAQFNDSLLDEFLHRHRFSAAEMGSQARLQQIRDFLLQQDRKWLILFLLIFFFVLKGWGSGFVSVVLFVLLMYLIWPYIKRRK